MWVSDKEWKVLLNKSQDLRARKGILHVTSWMIVEKKTKPGEIMFGKPRGIIKSWYTDALIFTHGT